MAGDLSHRSGSVRLNLTPTAKHRSRTSRFFGGFSPEAVFIIAGISQTTGIILAKFLFTEVDPGTVALIRVVFGSIVLLALSRRQWLPIITRRPTAESERWSRADLQTAAMFGITIALMNLFFFLAIDRLDLGKGAAIEFIGPIVVAASRTRTRRNAVAVSLAAVGVVLLSGLEIGGNPLGLVFIFLASTMWAVYIILGARVAHQDRGLAGLGVGLVFGAFVITPFGLGSLGAVLASPKLLLLCCLVGLLMTVIGYGLEQHVLRRIPTERFALLLALLPINATFFAFVVLDERPSALELLGISCVVIGVLIQQRDRAPAVDAAPAGQ